MPKLYNYACEVLRVVDGDTLDVLCDLGFSVHLQMRLRMAAINTPESRTRNLREKAAGKAAGAFLKETLESADSVEIESLGRGKFGRVLAVVYAVTNGKRTNVNQLLVRKGHAREYSGGKREPWFQD